MNRPAIKAGLLGGLVAAVVGLLTIIPLFACLSLPLQLLAYAGAGAAAAAWLPASGRGGSKVGAGAIAGLIAGLIGGLARMATGLISYTIAGGPAQILSQLPPESLQAFRQAGMDPSTLFGTGTVTAISGMCCALGSVIALGLGALGAAIYPTSRTPGRQAGAYDGLTAARPPESTASLGPGLPPAGPAENATYAIQGPAPSWPPEGSAYQNATQPPAWSSFNTPAYQAPAYQAPINQPPPLPLGDPSEDRALDTVFRLEQKSAQGNPANLNILLPYLNNRSVTVRAMTALACGEYLAAIAQAPGDQPASTQAAVDRAIGILLAAAAT